MNSSPRESPETYFKDNPNQFSVFPIFSCAFHVCVFSSKCGVSDADIKGGRVADFGSHALLHEGTELALIVDLDNFLGPIGRVGDVELHLDGGGAVKTVARVLSICEIVVEGVRIVDFFSSPA